MRPIRPAILATAGITLATAIPTASAASAASVEPADDYTAASLLAFALGGNGLG